MKVKALEVLGSNGHCFVESPPRSGRFYLPPHTPLPNKNNPTTKQPKDKRREQIGFLSPAQTERLKATEHKLVDVRQCKAWPGDGNGVMDICIWTEKRFERVQEPLRELQVFQFRRLLCAWLFYLCSRRKQKTVFSHLNLYTATLLVKLHQEEQNKPYRLENRAVTLGQQ